MHTIGTTSSSVSPYRSRPRTAAGVVAALVAATLAMMTALTAGAGTAEAKTHTTASGHTINLTANTISARSLGSVDLFSREAVIAANVRASIEGIEPGDVVQATLEVGYKIGYPVSFAPTGVKVTAETPSLTLNAGVNAKIAPEVTISGSGGGGAIGEIGAEAGAEATVIPPASLEFDVGAGKVTDVTLAEIALTRPLAEIALTNVQLSMSNALGPVQVRPYATISVTTDTGVYVFTELGNRKTI